MSTTEDPAELLARVATGDRTAFASFFAAYAPRIKGFLLKATRGNAVLAEELTQEVMLRVWRRAGSFDGSRGAVNTWVFTIARNVRIDHARKKRPSIDDADPVLVADEAPTADVVAAGQQRAERVRHALSALPAEQRVILERAYFGGASLREVALAEDVPLGTVKSRVRLAMTKLRAALGGLDR